MRESDSGSSKVEYTEEVKSQSYVKQLQWDMAIGLQEVDDLKSSKYMKYLVKLNIKNEISFDDLENKLKNHYKKYNNYNKQGYLK